jgi:tetratricopeptide (TPR) repeat protein
MEVLEHEHDRFQEELGEQVPILSAGEWLFQSFLPALQGHVVLLLAGRPSGLKERLEAFRAHHPRLMFRPISLEPLSKEETKEYLAAVAQAEGKQGNGDAATRLWSFSEEKDEVIHLLTRGRPILLALVADMMSHGWPLPPPFNRPLEDLRQRDESEGWPEVERSLVVRIQESPSPIGETVRTLAWLRKGATPELLARLMDLKKPSGEWDVHTATGYLDQASRLALVKVRPGDRRVFLHDEVYSLLEKHVLARCGQEENDRVHAAIEAYYRDLVRDLRQRAEPFPPVLASIQANLRQALVEEMHYRLRHSPPMGFAFYFWLAEEALGEQDAEMDMLLRTEFLRSMGMLTESDFFMGFVPREAEVDLAVRWGIRAIFLRNDPVRALGIFDQIRRRWGREAGKLGLAWAHLQFYEAVARVRRAEGDDWREARTLLATVEQRADEILEYPPETPVVTARRWRARILKSLALNYRGYLDRQQGRYLEAVKNYQESAMLQRRMGMSALVPTLTNLAYAMALTGQFRHARLLTEEAENLAQRHGKDHMLALALNVRAWVEECDAHHKAALRYTERALKIAMELPTPRTQGRIYLTRARARRYLWDSMDEAEKRRQNGSFEEALKEANQAVSLLRSNPPDRVDALLERGCVYRELARMYQSQGRGAEADMAAEKSRKDLERATMLAGAVGLPRHQALAWTNLGWLYYYTGRVEQVEESLQQANSPFPTEYLFPSEGPKPPMARAKRKGEATLPYWSSLGKAEMLRAQLALDQADAAPDGDGREEHLRAAVKHITLSLAYDELIADEYFDLSRAEEGIHKRILRDGLSISTLHRYAEQVAADQGLEQPTRLQRFLVRMFGPAELWV